MPRGGRRTGTPGSSYANRTDLAVPMAAATGQQYGKASEQMAAQRALPVARPATDAVGSARPSPGGTGPAGVAAPAGPPPGGPIPGGLLPLDAPTQRPNEPVTAGLPVGAGPGPEALGPLGGGPDVGMELRSIYARFPTEELRTLIEMLDDE